MPVDTSIYGNLLAKPASLADNVAALDQADLQRTQLAGAKLNLIGQQQTQADQQAVRSLYQRPGFDPATTQGIADLSAASPSTALATRKAMLENQKTQAETTHLGAQSDEALANAQKIRTQHAIEVQAQIAQAAGAATDQASWDRGLQIAQTLGADISQVPKAFDPAVAKQLHDQALTGAQQLDAHFKQLTSDESTRHNKADESNTVRGQNMTAETTRRGQTMENKRAGLDANGNDVGGGFSLSPEAKAAASARYNLDGTLPQNLGRGQQGSRNTVEILNGAAATSGQKGVSPDDQRINQIANKANTSAMSKLQQQQTMVGAFERNFTKNADITDKLFDKVDNTGTPIINKWINAGKKSVVGDPDIAALDASVKATVNEYAKIVSGATGSAGAAQGEITKIEGLLNNAQTRQQAASVLSLMRRETRNRMSAFDEEKASLRASMSGNAASAAASSSGSGVPPDIQAILDRHRKK